MEASSPNDARSPNEDAHIAGETAAAPHTASAAAMVCPGISDAITSENVPAGALPTGGSPEVTSQDPGVCGAPAMSTPAPQEEEFISPASSIPVPSAENTVDMRNGASPPQQVQNTTGCETSATDTMPGAVADVTTTSTSGVEVVSATGAAAGGDEMALLTDRAHTQAAQTVDESAPPPPTTLIDAANALPEPVAIATEGFEPLAAACGGAAGQTGGVTVQPGGVTVEPGGVAVNEEVDTAICVPSMHCVAPQTVGPAATDSTVDIQVGDGLAEDGVCTQACDAASGNQGAATSLPWLQLSTTTVESLIVPPLEPTAPTPQMGAVAGQEPTQMCPTTEHASSATNHGLLAAGINCGIEDAATATASGREPGLPAPASAEPATNAAADDHVSSETVTGPNVQSSDACADIAPGVDAAMLAPGADALPREGGAEGAVDMAELIQEGYNRDDAIVHMGQANEPTTVEATGLISVAAEEVQGACFPDMRTGVAEDGTALPGPARPQVPLEADAEVNAVLEQPNALSVRAMCNHDQVEGLPMIHGQLQLVGTENAAAASQSVAPLGADTEPTPYHKEPVKRDAGYQNDEPTRGVPQLEPMHNGVNEMVAEHVQVGDEKTADSSTAAAPEARALRSSGCAQQQLQATMCSAYGADEYVAVAHLDSGIGSPAPNQSHTDAGGQQPAAGSRSFGTNVSATCDELSMDVDTTTASGEPAQNTWDESETIGDVKSAAAFTNATAVEAAVECHVALSTLTATQPEGTQALATATAPLPQTRPNGTMLVQTVPTKEEEDAAATLSAVRHALRVRQLRAAAAPTTARRSGPEPARVAKPVHLSGLAFMPASHNIPASPGKRERQTTAAAPVKKARMALEWVGGGAVSPLPMNAVGSPYTGFFTM